MVTCTTPATSESLSRPASTLLVLLKSSVHPCNSLGELFKRRLAVSKFSLKAAMQAHSTCVLLGAEGSAAMQGMLASWRENAAALGASGAPGADALLTQLGDRLWQHLGEVSCLLQDSTAPAQACEANLASGSRLPSLAEMP